MFLGVQDETASRVATLIVIRTANPAINGAVILSACVVQSKDTHIGRIQQALLVSDWMAEPAQRWQIKITLMAWSRNMFFVKYPTNKLSLQQMFNEIRFSNP